MDEQAGTLQNSGSLVLCAVGFILDLLGPGIKAHWKPKYEGATILTQLVINYVTSSVSLKHSDLQSLHASFG